MKATGIALGLIGAALFLYAAFLFEPSVSTYGSGYLPDRVVNLDLQQRQLLLAMAGLALFISGVILYGFGELASSSPARAGRETAFGGRAPALPPTLRGAGSYADAELMARHPAGRRRSAGWKRARKSTR